MNLSDIKAALSNVANPAFRYAADLSKSAYRGTLAYGESTLEYGRSTIERGKRWLAGEEDRTPIFVDATPSDERLPEAVFAKEKGSIAARRQHHHLSENAPLTGLALSGGGIRSASFCLGVLQVLAENNTPSSAPREAQIAPGLKHIDYLSTVSGGGYIGCSLSTAIASQSSSSGAPAESPFIHELGTPESPSLKHLRDHANYLRRKGILNALAIPAILLRGMIVNLLVILPVLLLAAVVAIHVWGGEVRKALLSGTSPLQENAGLAAIGLVILLVVFALSPAVRAWFMPVLDKLEIHRLKRPATWWLRDFTTRWVFGLGILVATIWAFLAFQPTILWQVIGFFSDSDSDTIHEKVNSIALTLAGALSALTAVISFMSSTFVRARLGGITQIGLYVLGIVGPAILYLLYLILVAWALEPRTQPLWMDDVFEYVGLLTAWSIGFLVDVLETVSSFFQADVGETFDPWFDYLVDKFINDYSTYVSFYLSFLYMVVALSIGLFILLFYDANATSLHKFYRDRLSKTFFFEPRTAGDDLPLKHRDFQEISQLSDLGPYHLINATLNIQRSSHANLRGRGGASFVIAKSYTGSPLTGYCRTSLLEGDNPDFNLGAAMAISGAAASPNMGRKTLPFLTVMMTLLNVRLGYWLWNPNRFRDGGQAPAGFVRSLVRAGWRAIVRLLRGLFAPSIHRAGPLYLLFEMFGMLDERGKFVNLSDGGHFDNLGIYELVRRRCRFIIAVDAEADKDMRFSGLAEAIRLVRIDFGVHVHVDTRYLRRDPQTGLSPVHFAVGKIDYGKDEHGNPTIGYLLYLKSSVSGDENVDIFNYRIANDRFPNESTADQVFDEKQFETYRSLGFHVAREVLSLREDESLAEAYLRQRELDGSTPIPLLAREWLAEFTNRQ